MVTCFNLYLEISIFRRCGVAIGACEILIANPIDWLYATCLEYFIFVSVDSSEARKQYDEYCLTIMQTITYHVTERIFKATDV